MKYLKVLAIAIVAMFAFEGAKAQVVVGARIGSPASIYHPRRTVVVNRPAYRPHRVYHPRRTVVVTRPAYRPRYTRTVVRPAYYNNHKKVVVVKRRY